jgi:F420 biosynthesis protein FbiB-like protein
MITSPGYVAKISGGSSSELSRSTLINTTDFRTFLRTRRSIRRFRPDPVPDPVIEDILSTATLAPSAHHRQPWRFVILRDLSIRADLSNAMARDFEQDLLREGLPTEKIQAQVKRSKERITSAPAAILLCLDMSEMDSYPDSKRQSAEYIMAVQSVAAAGLQLLLAAHAHGLGGVWACWPLFAQESIQRALSISSTWEPQAMMFLGYPDTTPALRERKPLHEIVVSM